MDDKSHDGTSPQASSLSAQPVASPISILGTGLSGSYAISTVMNQPNSSHLSSAAFNAIKSSIPNNLKPTALSSLVSFPMASSRSTVLTASHKRSAPPPIKLSESPKISSSDFQDYIHKIEAQWTEWQKNLNIGSGGTANLRPLESEPLTSSLLSTRDSDSNLAISRHKSKPPPPLSGVPGVFFDRNFSLSNPITFDAVTEKIPIDLKEASLASNSLSNSDQFNQKTKLQPFAIPDLATDQILQEKLSHYLDIVELNLVQEISLRSSSFFSALGNLQSLHTQIASCMTQVETLTHELDQLRLDVAQRGLEIIKHTTRRRNIMKIEHAMLRVREIRQSVREVEEMVQAGDWSAALSLIESLEELWNAPRLEYSAQQKLSQSPPSSHDLVTGMFSPPVTRCRLNRLHTLKSLPNQLANLRGAISKTLEAEFVSILIHDLRSNIQNYDPTSKQGWDPNEPHSPFHSPSGVQGKQFDEKHVLAMERVSERVQPSFIGLNRSGGSELALASWKAAVIQEINSVIKKVMSKVTNAEIEDQNDTGDQTLGTAMTTDKTLSLTQDIKALSPAEFLETAQEIYKLLIGCLEAVNIQTHSLLKIAGKMPVHPKSPRTPPEILSPASRSSGSASDNLASQKPSTSQSSAQVSEPQSRTSVELETLGTKLTELIQAAAELANVRLSKIMSLRTEIHAAFRLSDFFAIFDATWRFVVQCEVISQRMIVALRGVMVGQAKAFLKCFHQNKITESAKIVEQEQWTQVEIPPRVQATLNMIVSSAMEDPKGLTNSNSDVVTALGTDSLHSDQPTKQLDVEGTLFHAVNAVLQTLDTLADYVQIVVNCSLLTTDAMVKIVEFLKAFNSRTCQVVLGAGAMRSAGLKNITAKHLALASQALSVMIGLIPYIRECLRRHLNLKQAVMLVDFDKLKRDYQEHQYEIHAKLVSIMSDRLAVHTQALQALDWEIESTAINAYLESLLKEVSTLHRVLSRYLSSSSLESIMNQVFSAICNTLREEFTRVELKSEQAKSRLLRDAQFFSSKLSDLKATEALQAQARDLEEMVQQKLSPETTSVNITIDNPPRSPTLSNPTSPLAERTEQFKSRFRFLSPRRSIVSTPSDLYESQLAPQQPASPQNASSEEIPSAAVPQCSITGENVQALTENNLVPDGIVNSNAEVNLTASIEPAIQSIEEHGGTALESNEVNLGLDISTGHLQDASENQPSTLSPPRMTLSQRLSALAASRRSQLLSPPSSVSETTWENPPEPTEGSEPAQLTLSPERLLTESNYSSSPHQAHSRPTAAITRPTLKERLVAIAHRAASATSWNEATIQSVTTEQSMENHPPIPPDSPPRLTCPVSDENFHTLPALPESPLNIKKSDDCVEQAHGEDGGYFAQITRRFSHQVDPPSVQVVEATEKGVCNESSHLDLAADLSSRSKADDNLVDTNDQQAERQPLVSRPSLRERLAAIASKAAATKTRSLEESLDDKRTDDSTTNGLMPSTPPPPPLYLVSDLSSLPALPASPDSHTGKDAQSKDKAEVLLEESEIRIVSPLAETNQEFEATEAHPCSKPNGSTEATNDQAKSEAKAPINQLETTPQRLSLKERLAAAASRSGLQPKQSMNVSSEVKSAPIIERITNAQLVDLPALPTSPPNSGNKNEIGSVQQVEFSPEKVVRQLEEDPGSIDEVIEESEFL